MDRLRAILLLRGALALFFVGLGVVLFATGNVVFGVFAIVVVAWTFSALARWQSGDDARESEP